MSDEVLGDDAPDGAPESTAEQAAELTELIHGLLHGLRREAAAYGAHGVAPGQVRFLRALERTGGCRRPGELAEQLDLAPRSVTTKVDLAEAAGHVERRPDPHDRRATLVALTDGGRRVLDAVSAERSRGAAARLVRLDPDERAQLLALLRRMTTGDDGPGQDGAEHRGGPPRESLRSASESADVGAGPLLG